MAAFESYRFETPENVEVQYHLAGLGSRFVAWFVDQIVVWMMTVALIILLIVVGLSFDAVVDDVDGRGGNNSSRATLYLAGVIMLVWGFGSFLYFVFFELLLRGQTVGKRISSIRVVKADGFQLDSLSIVVRNLFRVVDQLPPMWIIPFVSRRSQRCGDMVAGTLVVADAPGELSPVRSALIQRSAADAQFRFDQRQLKRITAVDFQAIERFLDRWPDLDSEQQAVLVTAYSGQLAKKLGVDPPPADQRLRFLEDLFSAELRRRERNLV
jgi:uncharacterized RDD family membrane protein YckC